MTAGDEPTTVEVKEKSLTLRKPRGGWSFRVDSGRGGNLGNTWLVILVKQVTNYLGSSVGKIETMIVIITDFDMSQGTVHNLSRDLWNAP